MNDEQKAEVKAALLKGSDALDKGADYALDAAKESRWTWAIVLAAIFVGMILGWVLGG